jgi:copper chaperone CopZ
VIETELPPFCTVSEKVNTTLKSLTGVIELEVNVPKGNFPLNDSWPWASMARNAISKKERNILVRCKQEEIGSQQIVDAKPGAMLNQLNLSVCF